MLLRWWPPDRRPATHEARGLGLRERSVPLVELRKLRVTPVRALLIRLALKVRIERIGHEHRGLVVESHFTRPRARGTLVRETRLIPDEAREGTQAVKIAHGVSRSASFRRSSMQSAWTSSSWLANPSACARKRVAWLSASFRCPISHTHRSA